MGAIAIASAAYSVYTTKKNAARQEKAARKAQAIQEEQIYDKASVEAQERNRQARAERARIRAMSAESGVSGLSVDEMLTDVDMQAGTDIANIGTNQYNAGRASRAGLQSDLNSIKQPDYIGTALNTAGQVYGMNQQYGNQGGTGG